MDDVAYGQLDQLAAPGSWNVGDLDNPRGHVSWRGVGSDVLADSVFEVGSEADALAQPHEQHDALIAVPLLADDQALDDLVELLDLPIDLELYRCARHRG